MFLNGQKDIGLGTYVTLLLENNEQITGTLVSETMTAFYLEIEEEYHKVKKKKIVGIIPKYVLDKAVSVNTLDEDLIILHNKIWVPCEILEMDNKAVYVKTTNSTSSIRFSEIDKVYPKGQEISYFSSTKKNEKEVIPFGMKLNKNYVKDGWYHIVHGTLISAGPNQSEFLGGIGGQYILGYQFTRTVGLGIGFGYLDLSRGDFGSPKLIPVFGEIRGYFSDNKTSAYYNLALGMTTGTKYEEEFYDNVNARLFTYPSLGYKIGSDRAAFMIDLGYQITGLEYTGAAVRNEIFEFNRVVLRIGVML